jgi:hypothetical protein
MIQSCGIGHREPVLIELLFGVPLLPQFIQLCQNGRRQHILNVDSTRALGVQEEKELLQRTGDIHLFKVLVDALEMVKGRDQLGNVFFEVVLSEITVSSGVIKADVDTGLEQVILSHY